MQIKQDPITRLYCRSDGAILMPPDGHRFKKFRWAFGSKLPNGYLHVGYHGKYYYVHQIVCRAFNGLAPEGKPEVDHINRIPHDNRSENLRWVNRKENQDNADRVDQAFEKYGVRCCDDKKAYNKAYNTAHREEQRHYQKAYREKYPEKHRALSKAYRESHREKCRALSKAYCKSHREEHNAHQRAYDAAKYAKMKAQGLTYRKGPDGKWGWYPFKRSSPMPNRENLE